MLRYFADQSEAEVARLLGCSAGTVKAHAARGLERMRSPSGRSYRCSNPGGTASSAEHDDSAKGHDSISPTARTLDYLAGRTTGPLFVTASGLRWTAGEAYLTVRRLARGAGIANAEKITPHSLRHTFVTLAREAGVPPRGRAGRRRPR